MDYDSVAKAGSMLGSGRMVIMDEDAWWTWHADHALYAHESCGWCIPCRKERPGWVRRWTVFMPGWPSEDIDLIADLAKNMLGPHVFRWEMRRHCRPSAS